MLSLNSPTVTTDYIHMPPWPGGERRRQIPLRVALRAVLLASAWLYVAANAEQVRQGQAQGPPECCVRLCRPIAGTPLLAASAGLHPAIGGHVATPDAL